MDSAQQVEKIFEQRYATRPTVKVRAPGRINLIGEHTDYNMGYVMPAAIDKSMYFAMKPNGTNNVTLYAADLDEEITFAFTDLSKTDRLWVNYFKGVLSGFASRGMHGVGFDLVMASDIPIGSGLSSSAALECGFIKGLDAMLDMGLSDWDIVHIGNISENKYLGIGSGILDQFGSTFGKEDKAMLLHCGDLNYEYLDINLRDYCLVLINTNVKHEHLTSGYNDRPEECRGALRKLQNVYPEVTTLSEAVLSMVDKEVVDLTINEKARVTYILEENQRVLDFKKALSKGDLKQCGKLLYASHEGLQHLYEVSCMELDLLVELSRGYDEVLGARMMGGGFGGCTLSIVKKAAAATIVEEITAAYTAQTSIEADVYWVNISNGVEII